MLVAINADSIENALEAVIKVGRKFADLLIVHARANFLDFLIGPGAIKLVTVAERESQHIAAASDVFDEL